MFLTLTQVLLWVLLFYIVWQVLLKKDPTPKPADAKPAVPGSIPKKPRDYLAWLGAFIVFLSIIWAFLTPNSPVMAEIWSVISFPLKPLGLSILLFLFALGGIRSFGITKDAWKQLTAGFMILLISSIPLVGFFLTQLTEEYSLGALRASMNRHETFDAIVLLGQATTQMTIFEPNQVHLSDAGDRVLQAAREYQQQLNLGNEPLLIVSAGPRPGLKVHSRTPVPAEADDIKKILQRLGVPGDSIFPERSGVDIRTSAEAVRKLVDKGLIDKRVILVSSALNMQRARQTFAQLGIETIPSPASFYTFQSGSIPKVQVYFSQKGTCDSASLVFRNAREIQFSDFMPSVEGLLLTTRVVNEFWSSVYYFLRGWLAGIPSQPPQTKDAGCY